MFHIGSAAGRLGSLAAVAVMLAGCSVLAGAGSPQPVVIGVDLALTGRGSGLDAVYDQALALRAGQVNQQREAAGLAPVRLRALDNSSDQATSRANLAELFADPQVSGIITGGCSRCVIAAVEAINDAGVPTVALSAASAVSEPVGQRGFVFRIGPEVAGTADVMAAELAGRGVARLGLVTGEGGYGSDAAGELAQAADALGMELVVHEVAAAGQDAAGLAARIAGWRPDPPDAAVPFAQETPEQVGGLDAVVLWTSGPLALEAAVALREAGWEGALWLAPTAAGNLFPEPAKAAAALAGARLLFSQTLVADEVVASLPHLAQRRAWFDSYVSTYGTYDARASYAADALDALLAAVDRIGTGRVAVRDTLEAVRLSGLTGTVGFTPGDHSGLDPAGLAVLRFAGDRWHTSTSTSQ